MLAGAWLEADGHRDSVPAEVGILPFGIAVMAVEAQVRSPEHELAFGYGGGIVEELAAVSLALLAVGVRHTHSSMAWEA